MSTIIAFLAGLLMSAGITYSLMIDPQKVLGFLTLNSSWDPSLLLVMLSALAVYATGYWLVIQRGKPMLASQFYLPEKTTLDKQLLLGALLFGAGWGLTGYCPGPAIAALSTGSAGTIVFVIAMVSGWFISKRISGKAVR